MSLPHVLLGLLHETPRTGYELARAFDDELDPAWTAGYSQIYPALARLRRNGWVRLRTLGPRRGPPRLLYRATAAGRRELQRWLVEAPGPPRHNDAILARVALLDTLSAPGRRSVQAALASALEADAVRLEALPLPSGSRGLARRAAVEARRALRRFIESSGRQDAPRRGTAPARRKSRPGARRRRMIGVAREEP